MNQSGKKRKKYQKETNYSLEINNGVWNHIFYFLNLKTQILLSSVSKQLRKIYLAMNESIPLRFIIDVKVSLRKYESLNDKLAWINKIIEPIENEKKNLNNLIKQKDQIESDKKFMLKLLKKNPSLKYLMSYIKDITYKSKSFGEECVSPIWSGGKGRFTINDINFCIKHKCYTDDNGPGHVDCRAYRNKENLLQTLEYEELCDILDKLKIQKDDVAIILCEIATKWTLGDFLKEESWSLDDLFSGELLGGKVKKRRKI